MNRILTACITVSVLLTIGGAVLDPPGFLRAWLLAALVGLALPLGALPVLMTHNLTGGRWGEPVRAPLKSLLATLPFMLLLFVPLLALPHTLFAWLLPAAELPDVVRSKGFYLNLPFFYLRFAACAATWCMLALKLNTWREERVRPRRASAAGLVLWGVTVTFFSFDWIMALEPAWYSDIFGLVFMGTLLSMAPAVLLLLPGVRWEELPVAEREGAQRDLALLWLAAILFWVFAGFSQYLVIWSGDLPHEIRWYLHRSEGGWEWLALAMILLCGVVPFVALLSPGWQRRGRRLAVLAGLVLLGHVLEFAWLVLPAYYPGKLHFGWRSPVAMVAVGAAAVLLYRRHYRHALTDGVRHA